MKSGRMEAKEAEAYAFKRLEEVKEILDDIADKTGVVFVCFGEEFAELFGKVGMDLVSTINNILKVIPDRLELANRAKQAAFEENFGEMERRKKRQEMRGLLDALIARSGDSLRADLEALKDKYSNFDVEEKK